MFQVCMFENSIGFDGPQCQARAAERSCRHVVTQCAGGTCTLRAHALRVSSPWVNSSANCAASLASAQGTAKDERAAWSAPYMCTSMPSKLTLKRPVPDAL